MLESKKVVKVVGAFLVFVGIALPVSDGERYDLLVAKTEQAYAIEFNQWAELKKNLTTGPKRSPIEKEQWKIVIQKERELELAVGSYE